MIQAPTLKYYVNSGELSSTGILDFYIDKEKSNFELYSFNNEYKLPFDYLKDTVPPQISVYFDGNLTKNGDEVSRKPKIKIELSDNSKLKFVKADSTKITRD